jgi:hypothetical protein
MSCMIFVFIKTIIFLKIYNDFRSGLDETKAKYRMEHPTVHALS